MCVSHSPETPLISSSSFPNVLGIANAPATAWLDTKSRIQKKEICMFLILAIVLLVVWGVGSLAFHAVGAVIHLLLAFALVSVVVHFVRGGGRGARV
jgi:hypothetical protein